MAKTIRLEGLARELIELNELRRFTARKREKGGQIKQIKVSEYFDIVIGGTLVLTTYFESFNSKRKIKGVKVRVHYKGNREHPCYTAAQNWALMRKGLFYSEEESENLVSERTVREYLNRYIRERPVRDGP